MPARDQQNDGIEDLLVSGELQNQKRSDNQDGRHHAVSIRRIGIKQVHAFVLQCRLNVLLDDRNRGIEAVLQAGQLSLLAASKNILHHYPFVRRQALPFGQRA